MGYLQQHLFELLKENDCVIIPELGGFVGNKRSAVLNERAQEILPPSKEISFNARLFHNDGIFAQDMRLREGVTFDKAMVQINAEVAWILRQLDAGKNVTFDKVGVLRKDKEGQLIFTASREENFLLDSFGLQKLQLDPINAEVEDTPVIPLKEEEVIVSPIRRKRALKNLAAAAAIPVFIMAAWFAGNPETKTGEFSLINTGSETTSNYHPRFEEESIQFPQISTENKIDQQVAAAPDANSFYYSFINEEVSPEGVKVILKEEAPATPVADAIPNVESTSSNLDLYFIVGGAFKEKSNAENYTAELRAKGYDASIFGKKGDLHMVAFGSYASKSSAKEALSSIRQKDNPHAWLKRK